MNIAWLHKSRHNKTGGSSSGWINRVAGETDHRSKMGQGRGPSHSNAHTNNANRLPYKHFPLVG